MNATMKHLLATGAVLALTAGCAIDPMPVDFDGMTATKFVAADDRDFALLASAIYGDRGTCHAPAELATLPAAEIAGGMLIDRERIAAWTVTHIDTPAGARSLMYHADDPRVVDLCPTLGAE